MQLLFSHRKKISEKLTPKQLKAFNELIEEVMVLLGNFGRELNFKPIFCTLFY